MKKLNILRVFSTITIAAAGLLGAANIKSSKSATKVEAASAMVSGSRVYIEDQSVKGWTKDGVDAIMHIYNVSFASGSGYASLADVKLNDLYAVSFATDGSTYLDVRMKWKSGSHRQYEAIIQWYISGFTSEFYATENYVNPYVYYKNSDGSKGSKMSVTLSRGDNLSIYMFNTSDWRGECFWSGSDFVAITSIPDRDTGYTFEFNGIKSGSHMYINTHDLIGWEQDNAKWVGTNDFSENVYRVVVNRSLYGYIIFNGDGVQTVDISLDSLTDGHNAFYPVNETEGGHYIVGQWTYSRS